MRHRAIGVMLAGVVSATAVVIAAQTESGVRRTIYVSATDRAGTYLAVSPADLTLKEGGKEWPILRVEPSPARLKISLAIDESFSSDEVVRRATYAFVERLQGVADIALYAIGTGTAKIVDYTSDPLRLRQPLSAIARRGAGGDSLVEALYKIFGDQRAVEGRRVVVLLATENTQRGSVTADRVFDELRNTGTVLHAVTIEGPTRAIVAPTAQNPRIGAMDEVDRNRLLNDGPTQSGGSYISLLHAEGFPQALDRIHGALTHEYAVTYMIPAGTKSDGRVSITSKRSGVTIRGPRQVPKITLPRGRRR